MAKLVDTLDLGSSVERRKGSSPFTRTKSGIDGMVDIGDLKSPGEIRMGSSPISPTTLRISIKVMQRSLTPLKEGQYLYPQPYAHVAQLVEHRTFNPGVAGFESRHGHQTEPGET